MNYQSKATEVMIMDYSDVDYEEITVYDLGRDGEAGCHCWE